MTPHCGVSFYAVTLSDSNQACRLWAAIVVARAYGVPLVILLNG